MGLHTPLQHSSAAVQAEPSALQAMSRGSGVEIAARLCSVRNAVTMRCEAAVCSSSHAVAGKVALPIKSAKDISRTACIHMITSLKPLELSTNQTIPGRVGR